MRVLFQTVPHVTKGPLIDGSIVPGVITFQASVYDTLDEFRSRWPNAHPPATAAVWTREANTNGNIVVPASRRHHPEVPPVAVPRSVLAGVPDDALVAMEWWWRPLT